MKNKSFIAILLSGTALFWGLIFFRLRLLQDLPWWYWGYRDTPLVSPAYLVISFVICGVALASVFAYPNRRIINIALLIVAGYSLQMSFGLAEGRGLEPFRDRILRSGELDCVRLTISQRDMLDMAQKYDEHIKQELWEHDYIRTKPPGTVLFFMMVERATSWLTGASTDEARLENLVSVSVFLFPFLAMLTIIPLYLLARFFLPADFALLPSALFISCPGIILISMDIDQFLFPLVGLIALWLGGLSTAADRVSVALLCGVTLFIALYVSFSLIPLLLLCPLLAGIIWLSRERAENSLKRFGVILGAGMIGFIAALLVFRVELQYDMFARYAAAIAAHVDIKAWMPGVQNVIAFGFVNNVEFACGLGVALTIIFLDQLITTTLASGRGGGDAAGYLAAAVAAVLLGLVIFGKVKGETARLWLFLVPVFALVGAARLVKRFPSSPRIIVLLVFILQIITAVELKRFQDLWRPLI